MTLPAVRCKLAENCSRCRSGTGHPAFIAVYDPARGEYDVPAGAVCTARWVSNGNDHSAGELCGAEAVSAVAGVGLCQHHLEQVENWAHSRYAQAGIPKWARMLHQADVNFETALRMSVARRERLAAKRSLVYYMRRVSDGMIKIGHSTQFSGRRSTLRAEHGELQVLLVHSGYLPREHWAHRQFRVYRIGGTEWFRPARPLLEWIYLTRQDDKYAAAQPASALPLDELWKLVEAAPRRKDLRWVDGKLQWPPDAAAA